MSYKAHFDAQAWIYDYATTVDAEGEQTWDCTAFIEADPALKAIVDKAIEDDGYFLDRDDVLMGDEAAPEWVQNWQRPFTITVEKAHISDKQRTAAEALGYEVDDETIQAAIDMHHGRHATLAESKLELKEKEAEFNTAGGASNWRTRSTPCGCLSRFPSRNEWRRVVL
jgi:hypothetical protein